MACRSREAETCPERIRSRCVATLGRGGDLLLHFCCAGQIVDLGWSLGGDTARAAQLLPHAGQLSAFGQRLHPMTH